ncbi:MAG: hypothetical protein ACTSQO_05465 [Candidatus Helarchaeota archaeon]
MLPFIFILGLNLIEFVLFQLIYISFHIVICFGMLILGLHLLYNDKNLRKIKNILKTIGLIELFDMIVVFLCNFLIIFGAVLVLLSPFFMFIVDLAIMFFIYDTNVRFSKIKVILLYILVIVLSFLLSLLITNSIFNLINYI